MDTILTIIISVFSGGVLTALIIAISGRRKTNAEANSIESATQQTVTRFYQEQVEKTIAQMKVLEEEVKELRAAVLNAQEKYERRVGTLHDQMDTLSTELKRANDQLETANKTIAELREEITELRKEITQLLIEKADSKKDG